MKLGPVGLNTANLRRFALHLLFGTIAIGLASVTADALIQVGVDARIAAVAAIAATAAASFFRSEASKNEQPPISN